MFHRLEEVVDLKTKYIEQLNDGVLSSRLGWKDECACEQRFLPR